MLRTSRGTWPAFVVGIVAGWWVAGPGCADECAFDVDDGDVPIPAIECPAGELCYRGECFVACNAGREGLERCRRQDDCSGARPFCSDDTGFCSACPNGQGCVPTLDICRPVSSVPVIDIPERPEDNDFVPPGPLDAGLPDGSGLVRFPDLGDPDLGEFQATYALHVFMARQSEVPSTGTCASGDLSQTASVSVRAWDVRRTELGPVNWRADFAPPRAEELADPALREGTCEIRLLRTSTGALSADIGTVVLEDPGANIAVLDNWVAEPASDRYDVRTADREPPDPRVFVPNRLFDDLGEVQIFGFGRPSVTNGSFGALLALPFEFEPSCQSYRELRDGFRVPAAPRADLVFGWKNPLNGTSGQFVYVTIDAAAFDHELVCEDSEASGASTIVITASLLEKFRNILGPTFNASERRLRLRFGRRNLRRIQVNPATGESFFATAEVSLHVRSSVVFEGP